MDKLKVALRTPQPSQPSPRRVASGSGNKIVVNISDDKTRGWYVQG